MKRGQYGPVGFLMLFGILLFAYPFVFAPMFTIAGQNAIAAGATGIDAFFWSNLNLWVILCMVLIMIVYLRFGGGE